MAGSATEDCVAYPAEAVGGDPIMMLAHKRESRLLTMCPGTPPASHAGIASVGARPKMAEFHLGNTYCKLCVRSRAEFVRRTEASPGRWRAQWHAPCRRRLCGVLDAEWPNHGHPPTPPGHELAC